MTTTRFLVAACIAATTVLGAAGCAVTRDQQTVGSYIDDTTLTARVKAKFAESPVVSAMAISVETLKGTVQLSGFAKSLDEKQTAGRLALETSGVVAVQNNLVVRN